MATLCLDPELEHGDWRDLHGWLGGDWAVLFSNPEDFASPERQQAPWIAAMRQQFSARALHALAVRRDTRPLQAALSIQSSGVCDLHSNRETVWLREPPFAAADAVSFAARALRGELLTARSRFVMFIDGSLKRRQVLRYGGGTGAVSAADVLATIDALRGHLGMSKAA